MDLRAIEAPLMPLVRARLVEDMAEVLSDKDVWRVRYDAIQALSFERRFPLIQVMRFVDEAMAVAAQRVVAKEMGES